MIVLRGPNGVGKTSLMRVLAGLTTPDAGSVAIDGVVRHPQSETWRRRVVYGGHADGVSDALSARENLEALLALDGYWGETELVLSALSRVGLFQCRDLPARKLSAGQRRRIGLARLGCLAPLRDILLLDEPTNALDDEGVNLFTKELNRIVGAGGAVVVASHLPLQLVNQRECRLEGAS